MCSFDHNNFGCPNCTANIGKLEKDLAVLKKENERLSYFFAYVSEVEAQRNSALDDLAALKVKYRQLEERHAAFYNPSTKCV